MSEQNLGPTCGTCLAYHADAVSPDVGECRCHAPKPSHRPDFVWPFVDGDDWCLQHRQNAPPFGLTFIPDAEARR